MTGRAEICAAAERAAVELKDRSLLGTMLGPRVTPADWLAAAKPAEAGKEKNPPGRDRADRHDPALETAIDHLTRDAGPSAVLQMIARAMGPDDAEAEFLRARLARSLFASDRNADALRVASASLSSGLLDRRRGTVALIAGLAAWRLERIARAQAYFTDAAEAPLASDAVRAAAAFWASRTALRLQGVEAQQTWLHRAASRPWSFYGFIARRILGVSPGFRETLSQADLDALAALPAAHRAFAWLQLGQTTRAESDFQRVWPVVQTNPPLRGALLLVATRAHLIRLAARLADLARDTDCGARDDSRLPMPPLRPAGRVSGRSGTDLRHCPDRIRILKSARSRLPARAG